MRLQNKIVLLLLVLFIALSGIAQTTYRVSGKINGCKPGKIFLSKIEGKQAILSDSAVVDNECGFTFSMPAYTGVLRLSLNDSDHTDIIFNNENVFLNFISVHLNTGVDIIESIENKMYFDYLIKTRAIEDSAAALIDYGQKLYDADAGGNAATLKKLMKQIDALKNKKNEICFKLAEENKSLFASKLIRADIVPDFTGYMKSKDAAPYPNEAAFLKEHYFDYVDFSDSSLINSDVFYNKCGDYFGYFADPPSAEAYNDCIDVILVRAQANKKVYNYIISTLVSTFEHTNWEEVYLHIVEKCNENNTCSDDATARELNKSASIIKSLRNGSVAPPINACNLDGEMQSLDSLKSKYTLVMFWASWCEFCEDDMPDIKTIYTTYKSKGFEVFSVSCDSVKEVWQFASKKYDLPWINTCDLKGFKSDAIINYHIWQTPTYYLLDSNHKIIARPINIKVLSEKLNEINWEVE